MKNLIAAFTFLLVIILLIAPSAEAASPVSLTSSTVYHSNSGTLTYTIAWEVSSSSPVTNLALQMPLAAGTSFVSASQNASVANGLISWNFGNVPAGATGTASFIASLDSALMLNPWVTEVQSSLSSHDNGTAIKGQADSVLYEMKPGEELTLSFGVPIVAGPGSDVLVYAPSGMLKAWVSNNGIVWKDGVVSDGVIEIGNDFSTYSYLKLGLGASSSSSVTIDAVKSIHLFPFSCAVVTNPVLTGISNAIPFALHGMVRVDMVQGCGSGSGSGTGSGGGFSGTGVFNGFNPGTIVNDYTPPTTPSNGNNGSGGSSDNPSTEGGGVSGNPGPGNSGSGLSGNQNSGGGLPFHGTVTVPGGSVLGTSTPNTGGNLLGGNAEGQGGSDEDPLLPQVLGESTTLPRTGVALSVLAVTGVVLIISCIWFLRKKSHA